VAGEFQELMDELIEVRRRREMTKAIATPPISPADARILLAKAAAAGAPAEQVANLEAQIHAIEHGDPLLMTALRTRPSIADVVRSGD
jgi:hypothetical protein